MDKHGDLAARDLAVLWHPCSQMRDYQDFPPLEIIGAHGVYLELADGRRLIDAVSSWWCKSLGHGHHHLRGAVQQQLARFEHVIFANTTYEPAVRLGERLVALANGLDARYWGPLAEPGRCNGHFGKVFFADNGSTAVEIALKMALQAQAQRGKLHRRHFAALQNGYHGETLATLAVGDCDLYRKPFDALMFPVTMLEPVPYRSGPDDPLWLDASVQWCAMQKQLDKIADSLAAIVYEPVLQAAGGMRLYSPDLLTYLRQWADAHDVYLIGDEIAAGMGRCGTMLASNLAPGAGAQALPDFVLLSKGLTGGFLPLSAVITTDAVYDLFDGDYVQRCAFMHSNTYTGNALAVAAANAALDMFATEDILEQVTEKGPLLVQGLVRLACSRPYLHHVRGCGMIAAVDICREDATLLDWRRRTGYRVYREAVERGALLRPLGDTMYLCPPLNIAEPDIDCMLQILSDSLDATMA